METNKYVLSGEFVRAYVCEVEPGDVNIFGEIVESVCRISDVRTIVKYVNGHVSSHGGPLSTILIKA